MCGVEHEEDEEESDVSTLQHSTASKLDEEENRHDDVDDANKQEVLDEPRSPLQPVVHPHQLQSLLKTESKHNCTLKKHILSS